MPPCRHLGLRSCPFLKASPYPQGHFPGICRSAPSPSPGIDLFSVLSTLHMPLSAPQANGYSTRNFINKEGRLSHQGYKSEKLQWQDSITAVPVPSPRPPRPGSVPRCPNRSTPSFIDLFVSSVAQDHSVIKKEEYAHAKLKYMGVVKFALIKSHGGIMILHNK